jgi:hypothetical protein
MVKFIKGMLYTCECGYETTNTNLASKHSRTVKCKSKTIEKKDVEFVLKEDYLTSIGNQTSNSGVYLRDCPNSNNSITNVNIHLTVPDKSVVQSIYDAVKNPECVAEIRGADPQQIPAILFKYTRGTKAEQQMIQYDADKNIVKCVDPVTKKEVSKDLKKYRNEYLVENADIYDKDYHIPYMPPKIQPAMRELADPQYDTGKKKEEPIPGADVIKMCAAGDHRMYKLPHDSKKFYTQVANNVDKEIKSTT